MIQKLKNITVVFLALALIMSNMGSLAYSFGQTNIAKENITTEYK
ncbi:hypothetical protein TPDSL_14970 [Terrisporobacter petrolearius]